MSNFDSVLATTFAALESGEDLREAFARSSAAHRDPQHERRLDRRRGELALLGDDELRRRADRHHIRRDRVARAYLIELIARHEVSHEKMREDHR